MGPVWGRPKAFNFALTFCPPDTAAEAGAGGDAIERVFNAAAAAIACVKTARLFNPDDAAAAAAGGDDEDSGTEKPSTDDAAAARSSEIGALSESFMVDGPALLDTLVCFVSRPYLFLPQVFDAQGQNEHSLSVKSKRRSSLSQHQHLQSSSWSLSERCTHR
jgi:hypothetical protein